MSRAVVSSAGLALLAIMAALYTHAPDAYFPVMTAWMLKPFQHPFIDWEFIPTAIACWNKGVDVYRDNTCYLPVPHGQFNYSPLWLRLTFLQTGAGWVNPAGITLAVCFLVSLAALPTTGRTRDITLTLLATCSSVTVFALERGNVDIIIFLLALAGGHFAYRCLPCRYAGYGIFTIAGLLKYYPMVLLVTMLRETPRRLAVAGFLISAVLLLFVLAFGQEAAHAREAIPAGSYFTDLFGAVNLPFGLAQLAGAIAKNLGMHRVGLVALLAFLLPRAIALASLAVTVRRAIRLAERHGFADGFARLPPAEAGFLVIGAALVCGCFFAGQSVGYRGIFLLFALPGLLRLSHALPDARARAVARTTCLAIVFVMWVLTIQYGIVAAGLSRDTIAWSSPVGLVHWLLHELAWWWIVSVLLSVLWSFAQSAPAWRLVRRRGAPAV